ncbi:hypothetical protein ONA91_34345 [Micromonospora sp. DR5-3]|uniref:hypothetical protein n=1 Tax=unclassified Micromonospora TaxID=2617518 RepID=UPI0011DBFB53|nr:MULTISPECIES: hypothetical protein [unclassified Micromonospora]MCW3819533.1 hypothetical protein [Micromonospora sp. DR5-3]TYC12157.1 hypothetical protein FXF52_40255 [Micromonospora sp. MP36]
MDPTRSMLLALARHAEEARLRWNAERAAMRARGETPTRSEAYAYQVQANLCLITAIGAADLPANFRIYDITLSRDPLAAAEQLRQSAVAHDHSGPIEAAHEAARLAYKSAFAQPVTAQEQQYADLLASLPAARRDKIVDLAEQRARQPEA